MVTRGISLDEDPFAELEVNDDTEELRDMICRLGNADEHCSAEDFTSADNDLPVCSDTGSELTSLHRLAQKESVSPLSAMRKKREKQRTHLHQFSLRLCLIKKPYRA